MPESYWDHWDTFHQAPKPHVQWLRTRLTTGGKPSETSGPCTALWPALPSPAFVKIRKSFSVTMVKCQDLYLQVIFALFVRTGRFWLLGLKNPYEHALPVLMPLPHGHKHFCFPQLQQACFFPMKTSSLSPFRIEKSHVLWLSPLSHCLLQNRWASMEGKVDFPSPGQAVP